MTNITQSLKVIFLAIVLSFGISYVFAWTPPTVAPTGGNSAAPLNTSSNDQTKNGNLFLNALGITNTAPNALNVLGGAVFGGNVGVGTATPTEKLDVVGNIKASGTVCDGTGTCIGGGGTTIIGYTPGAVWVGYKWVPNGTQINCGNLGSRAYARISNGVIQTRAVYDGTPWGYPGTYLDTGWITGLYAQASIGGHTVTAYAITTAYGAPSPGNYGLYGTYSTVGSPCSINWP